MPGDMFYIILKGKVKIEVTNKRVEVDKNQKEIEKEETIHITDLTEGSSFGELALIDKKPRAATIICITDCDFLTLDKKSFKKILSDIFFLKFIN